MSVVCSFVGGFVSDTIIKGAGAALKFEIITSHPEELSREIMERLRHGCTRIPARGMYSGTETALLICVVSTRQRTELERIITRHEDTFAYCSHVRRTYGYFRR
jgi:uncharacterized membrane-anchored protein YitT (DUF2179 family)